MPNRHKLTTAALVAGLIASSSAAWAQQSTNFSMDRISVAAVGTTASSTNFETTVVAGQDSPSGASSSCNLGFTNSLGFWSVLGDLPVPIELHLDKNDSDPSVVELSWSGADDVFYLLRSDSPVNLVENPPEENLYLETLLCDAIDDQASASDLLFYLVVPEPVVPEL